VHDDPALFEKPKLSDEAALKLIAPTEEDQQNARTYITLRNAGYSALAVAGIFGSVFTYRHRARVARAFRGAGTRVRNWWGRSKQPKAEKKIVAKAKPAVRKQPMTHTTQQRTNQQRGRK